MQCVIINIYKVFAIFILCTNLIAATDFPSGFPRCKKSDPNFNTCLANAIDASVKKAAENGIPELNIPKLEPIETPEIVLDTQGGTVKVLQTYQNVKWYGLGDTKITTANFDFDKKLLTFTSLTPNLLQSSTYTYNGNILVVPIRGHGKADVTALNSTLQHSIQFEEKVTKAGTFFKVKSYTLLWDVKGIIFGLENLFDGNKELSDNILKVLNENWQGVWDDVKEGFETAYSKIFQNVAEKFFNAVPVDQIFPE